MNIGKAFLIVAGVLVLGLTLIWGLSEFVKSEILLGIFGFAGAVSVAAFQYRAAKKKEVEARLFPEKEKVYASLIQTIMQLFVDAKNPSKKIDEEVLVKKLLEIKTQLIIWGSYETLHALDEMGYAFNPNDPSVGLTWIAKMISSMRKDLGHEGDPDIAGREIALGLLVPQDREAMRQLMISKT